MRFYYRYAEVRYTEQQLMLTLCKFPLLRTTPCGVWLDVYGRERFVLSTGRKRFAWCSSEEALVSFYARKDRQIKILTQRLREAQTARTLRPGEREMAYVPL